VGPQGMGDRPPEGAGFMTEQTGALPAEPAPAAIPERTGVNAGASACATALRPLQLALPGIVASTLARLGGS
jgi:hypothetical protein